MKYKFKNKYNMKIKNYLSCLIPIYGIRFCLKHIMNGNINYGQIFYWFIAFYHAAAILLLLGLLSGEISF